MECRLLPLVIVASVVVNEVNHALVASGVVIVVVEVGEVTV